MKKYFPITKVAEDQHSATHLKIDLSYTKGGGRTRRGYYTHVTPVTIKQEEGYNSESFMIFDGFRTLTKEVGRKSAKAETEAENILLANNMDAIKQMVKHEMSTKYEIDWNEVEV